jgi:hypothetical protein
VELEEFIRNSLLQIMKGVKTAQTEWAADGSGGHVSGGGVINPSWGASGRVQEVKFDIAVTAASKTEGGGGGGIKVLSVVDLSGKVVHSAEHNTVSRISFAVPILPATTTRGKMAKPRRRPPAQNAGDERA